MSIHLEKRHCFIHPCICACVRACVIKDKTAQTVNGDWRHASPRGYERVFVSLISQESSSCLICMGIPLTRQANLVMNKNLMKNIRAEFSRCCFPVKEILDLTFIPGQNLLIFSFSKTIPVQQNGGDWSERNRSNRDALRSPGRSRWPVLGAGATLIVLILRSCF